jgi:hypothetical protein
MPLIIDVQFYDGEWRVPSPEKLESEAYYTMDIADAFNTAKKIHGKDIEIKIREVEGFIQWT